MALVESKSQHLRWLRTALESSDTLTVVHNAIFDVGILHKIGIMPAKVADTMVMAYLLGEPSIGLKTLSYRYCNMDLTPYKQMVAAASEEKARAYISAVVAREWPDPPPVVETRPSGEQHVKFPQNISKRLPRYLKKYEDGTAAMDLVEYWNHKDRDADRQMVEPVLGQLEPGCLSDIPLAAAVHYACTDADATFRLYPYLWQRIVDEEMEDVFWRDMDILPMVVDMMETGILIDTAYFHGLSAEFDQRAQQLLEEIESINGAYLNPASSKQVLEALKRRGLDVQSTEAGELDQYRHDELVRLIQDYRGIVKLNSTYVSVLPDFADAAGRVHTTLSTTRTSTGRLASSSPNLQNQPVRSEDGRRIRSGFIAERSS